MLAGPYGAQLSSDPPGRTSLGCGRPVRRGRIEVAVSLGRPERGLAAVGYAVLDPAGETVGPLSVPRPLVRFHQERVPGLVAALSVASDSMTGRLAVESIS